MQRVCLILFCLLMAGCAGPDVKHYAGERPQLDLVAYFAGRTQAWGMVQKRGGEVTRRFHVVIDGTAEADRLVLDEHFTYSDGQRQQRVWTLRRQPDGAWKGTAADVVGDALGTIAGNALNWRYTLRVPIDGSDWDLQFDDWMFLMDERTLVNRASMSKFGVEVGQVTLFFRKGD